MIIRSFWLVSLFLALSAEAALSSDYFRGIQATLAQEEAVAETIAAETPTFSPKELPMPDWEARPIPWTVSLLCWGAALACLALALRPLIRHWREIGEYRRLDRLLRNGTREEIRAAFAKTARLPPGSDFQELAEALSNSPWQEKLRRREEEW